MLFSFEFFCDNLVIVAAENLQGEQADFGSGGSVTKCCSDPSPRLNDETQ